MMGTMVAVHKLCGVSYLRSSIGHMLVVGDFTALWFYRTRMVVMLTVLGWGVSIIDVWHEDAPPVAELVNRRGFWMGPNRMYFMQGIRAQRPMPSILATIAIILIVSAWLMGPLP